MGLDRRRVGRRFVLVETGVALGQRLQLGCSHVRQKDSERVVRRDLDRHPLSIVRLGDLEAVVDEAARGHVVLPRVDGDPAHVLESDDPDLGRQRQAALLFVAPAVAADDDLVGVVLLRHLLQVVGHGGGGGGCGERGDHPTEVESQCDQDDRDARNDRSGRYGQAVAEEGNRQDECAEPGGNHERDVAAHRKIQREDAHNHEGDQADDQAGGDPFTNKTRHGTSSFSLENQRATFRQPNLYSQPSKLYTIISLY